jgi:dTDP-4-amino-4,6-dideoxygalactose transaminase
LLDIGHYDELSAHYGVPVVIDAAASLGTLDHNGLGFATGCRHMTVFSLHATKLFAMTEGGLIYSADPDMVDIVRMMSNFGFQDSRMAMMPGLNGKMDEITALMGLRKLGEIDHCAGHRWQMAHAYSNALPGLTRQYFDGERQAFVFMPMLLPNATAVRRQSILDHLANVGVHARTYFSPHLAEHPFFQKNSIAGDLTVTDEIASRIICLPMSDALTIEHVRIVSDALHEVCA